MWQELAQRVDQLLAAQQQRDERAEAPTVVTTVLALYFILCRGFGFQDLTKLVQKKRVDTATL